ncbi:MAG: hypothetical protein H0U25_08110, partial [Thermoleophilaceae bacterium]|nr:hypothetical protein [Thermoleophilaceae bacterium]
MEAEVTHTRAEVRAYHPHDSQATAALLSESAGGMYDRYAGSRTLAERTLIRALRREGTTASADVVRVAELDGHVAGAMAAMPFDEWTPRAHAFLRTTLRSIPAWRWPATLWLYRASGRTAPQPPPLSFYGYRDRASDTRHVGVRGTRRSSSRRSLKVGNRATDLRSDAGLIAR